MNPLSDKHDPVVVSGIGMATSVGLDRESTWAAIRHGQSGIRRLDRPDLPPRMLGATLDLGDLDQHFGRRIQRLGQHIAAEALRDARITPGGFDPHRFGCHFSGCMGETSGFDRLVGKETPAADALPWCDYLMPNSACVSVARKFQLHGPRTSHNVACASGTVEVLSAARVIQDGQADMMLAGSVDLMHPLLAAGFRRMRVLAEHDDPTQACRPFDQARNGFVMGEGGALLVLERMSHAQARGARIYAEVAGGQVLSDAQHITDLDQDAEGLAYAIRQTLRRCSFSAREVDYINVHGTGTKQNDRAEATAIRSAFGRAASNIPVSATKSMVGHLVMAAGSVELAITALALRDGFVPPTINLTDPDPQCRLDHVSQVGRNSRPQTALKLSVAFGGHLAVAALRRWNDADSGFEYPIAARAA